MSRNKRNGKALGNDCFMHLQKCRILANLKSLGLRLSRLPTLIPTNFLAPFYPVPRSATLRTKEERILPTCSKSFDLIYRSEVGLAKNLKISEQEPIIRLECSKALILL